MRRRSSRWFLTATVTTLTVASVLSLGVTWRYPVSSPFVRSHEGSLTHLAHTAQRSVNVRFAFYLELDDRTEGATLVVPGTSWVDAQLASGLAGMTVEERVYDPALIPDSVSSQGEPLGLHETPDGDLPYWILPGDPDETRWIARTVSGLVVVPESIAPIPVGDS